MKTTTRFNLTQGTFLVHLRDYFISDWAKAFLNDRKAQNLAIGSLRFYNDKLSNFLRWCSLVKIELITELTPDNLRDYLFYLKETGHNPGGIHSAYRTIKAFLNWFENEEEPENWKNPIRKIKAPKVPNEILEPVELSTIYDLVNICGKGFTGERDKAIFLTLVDTGCRANEFLNIDLEDMDIIHGSIWIKQGKGRKPRTVGISSKTKKAIKNYLRLRNDDLSALWVKDDFSERLAYPGLREILKRRSKLIGIKPPSLHSFRRSFAINFLRNGGDLVTLANLLGHTSLAVVQKYLKLLPEDLLIAHKKFSPVENFKNN